MNKLVLFSLLITQSLFGNELDTLIVLEAHTSKGQLISKDVFFVKDGAVIVNKEKLSATETITQSDHISNIAAITTVSLSSPCSEGIYKHSVKKGKILKIEKGCLGSERYNFLKENFKALKKDRITE